jgi:hypothetical protein
MSLRQKYVSILSAILPAGALGVSLLLGATGPSTANTPSGGSQRLASDEDRVSERLAAVREAVSAVAGSDSGPEKAEKGKHQLAWGNWWGGWGYRPWGYYGWPNWPNWNNWHNWNNWNNSWRNW